MDQCVQSCARHQIPLHGTRVLLHVTPERAVTPHPTAVGCKPLGTSARCTEADAPELVFGPTHQYAVSVAAGEGPLNKFLKSI